MPLIFFQPRICANCAFTNTEHSIETIKLKRFSGNNIFAKELQKRKTQVKVESPGENINKFFI